MGPKDFADLSPLIKNTKTKISITSIRSIKCRCTNNTKQPKSRLDSSCFYKTVMSDLSDLADVYYDILAFFSPTGIKSLQELS
jgi:uroporphyrinogen-III synthase